MSRKQGLMQQVLGEDWQRLPVPLKAHYQVADNQDVGELTVAYPGWLTAYYYLLHSMGALLHRRGRAAHAVVRKQLRDSRQYWRREASFGTGKPVVFSSVWESAGDHQVLEYVNGFMGLLMRVSVEDEQLHYEGVHVVLRLGPLKLPIPEWLVLGHTRIVEWANADGSFAMDFRMVHPWFGELYRYSGTFITESVLPDTDSALVKCKPADE